MPNHNRRQRRRGDHGDVDDAGRGSHSGDATLYRTGAKGLAVSVMSLNLTTGRLKRLRVARRILERQRKDKTFVRDAAGTHSGRRAEGIYVLSERGEEARSQGPKEEVR